MIAAILALLSALAFAVCTVVQHRAATESGAHHGRPLRLLGVLLRRRSWLAGEVAAALGLLLHAGALRVGRVVVVQPLLSSGLVMALVLGFLVDRRHPGRPLPHRGQWAAAVTVACGLALFLLTARPAGGHDRAPLTAMTVLAVATLAVVGAAALWGRRPGRPHRALVLGIGAGIGFGTTGLLLKQLMAGPVPSWRAGATAVELVAIGAVALMLAQWAYTAGALIESLPVATVLEPVLGVVLAGPLFGEWLASGVPARAGQIGGGVAVIAGVVLLARYSALRLEAERAESDGVRAAVRTAP